MKKTLCALLAGLLIVSTFSCNEDEKDNIDFDSEGTLALSFSLNTENSNRSNADDAAKILISIENEAGELVIDNKEYSLYNFNGTKVTNPIALKTGGYSISKFVVLSSSLEVLYASPYEGSEYAYLVNEPLPLSFEIDRDEVTSISPTVISVRGKNPEAFGFTSFGFAIQETFDFLIKTFVFDHSTKEYNATEALLSVFVNDTLFKSFNIGSQTDTITLRSNISNYKLEVEKVGFAKYSKNFSTEDLKELDEPLTIVLYDESKFFSITHSKEDKMSAMVKSWNPNFNYYDYIDSERFVSETWTKDGNTYYYRSFMNFDLSEIAENSTVVSAKLTLHSIDGYWGNAHNNSNSSYLERITSSWSADEVTWNNQPTVSEDNRATINAMTNSDLFQEIDITNLIQDILNDKTNSYGLRLRQVNETIYRYMTFGSFAYPDETKRPVLEIVIE